ncbi:HAD family phosphatase [Sutterella sp.]|uniref:HAD family hydrolase n=1 Tax=Sutterella sp. TaxID=1981025 RepID=UPI0026E0D8F7|nr:HAD family phosphatase [Sutterella sp.]MDO5531752.1 HAD family phosphatase [Sutterella sp.]
MKLAVFDLDHTLLPIDSGDAWSHWIATKSSRGRGDELTLLQERIEGYADAYRTGTFVALDFIHFQFGLLAREKREDLERWRAEFIDSVVRPAVLPQVTELLEEKRREGWKLLLATGTHRFVTDPVARMLGIPYLAAATPEERPDGSFTGELVGHDSYGAGKLLLVREWIERLTQEFGPLEALEAWSDSINDLPLLEYAAGAKPAGRAVAANPDPRLAGIARERGWETVRLFEKK